MIVINEIFFSIQGESTWMGLPTTFVRTSGCHLRCNYCDTKFAYHEGTKMEIKEVIDQIAKNPTKYVCITGGEPLLQKEVYELMTSLCDKNYKVSLETSGDIDCKIVDERVKKIIDVKTPDSGEPNKFSLLNLAFADKNTEYKFVICSENDFAWAEQFCHENGLFHKSNVLYSPSFENISAQWLAENILKNGSSARFQLQLHKYIWTPDTRGV
ncbi:MAG: radical SAM protein [Bdellovibrionaceae bacterium]|nr:radical SAM protein [Pseudobdellovibrionaceae bacterium]